MNNINLLSDYVYAHPDEKTPALALVDELLACTRMTPGQARRHVCRLRAAKRKAREVKAATRILQERGSFYNELTERIRRAAKIPPEAGFQIWIISGRGHPKGTGISHPASDEFWTFTIVTVGAQWVERTWFDVLDDWMQSMRL